MIERAEIRIDQFINLIKFICFIKNVFSLYHGSANTIVRQIMYIIFLFFFTKERKKRRKKEGSERGRKEGKEEERKRKRLYVALKS